MLSDGGLRLTRSHGPSTTSVPRCGRPRRARGAAGLDAVVDEEEAEELPRPDFQDGDRAHRLSRPQEDGDDAAGLRAGDELPARTGREAAPVCLDAVDAGPPVAEVVRLGQEGPDVRAGREQLPGCAATAAFGRSANAEQVAEAVGQQARSAAAASGEATIATTIAAEARERRRRRAARARRAADEPRDALRVDEDLADLQPRDERRRHPGAVALEELDQVEVRPDGDDQLGALLVGEQQRDVLADPRRADDLVREPEPLEPLPRRARRRRA